MNRLTKPLSVAAIAFVLSYCGYFLVNREPAIPPLPPVYKASVTKALEQSGSNRGELVRALAAAKSSALPGMCDVISRMPQYDLAAMDSETLVSGVNCAYEARGKVPWGAKIDMQIFMDYVLPYRIACESLEDWRPTMMKTALPLIEGCKDSGEAALKLNKWLTDKLFGEEWSGKRKTLGGAYPFDYTPLEGLEYGGSCNNACLVYVALARSVCIPVRLLEIPFWHTEWGVHMTVEWYDTADRQWHQGEVYPGPPVPELAMREGAIPRGLTVYYGYPSYMPQGDVWGKRTFEAMDNISSKVSATSCLQVFVRDRGRAVNGATVAIYVWCRGCWRIVTRTKTDASGSAQTVLGANDRFRPYMVSAAVGNRNTFDFVTLPPDTSCTITLDLAAPRDSVQVSLKKGN